MTVAQSTLNHSAVVHEEDSEEEDWSSDSEEADETLQADVFVQNYTELVYNPNSGKEEDINYDKYHYAVC